MTIERNVDGVIDYCFDTLEDIDGDEAMAQDKKLQARDMMLKHIWRGASVILEQKKLMLKSPELAKNDRIDVPLGKKSRKQIENTDN